MTAMSKFLRALCLSAWVFAVTVCSQPVRAASLEQLLACLAVSDPASRLACFDREATALSKAAASAPSPVPRGDPVSAVATGSPPPAGMKPVEEFGLAPGAVVERETQAGARPAPLDHVDAHVTALTKTADGLLVFTLDNGQVWKQLAHEGEMLASVGDSVRISRGWLGSYIISLPSRSACKVARLR
jgi:hypothetical protein